MIIKEQGKFYSLFVKIFISSLFLFSITLSFITIINVKREITLSRQYIKDQGNIVVEILEKSIQDYLYFKDVDKCSIIMETLGQNSQIIKFGKLYTSTGRLFASTYSEFDAFGIESDPRGLELLQLNRTDFLWEADQLIVGKSIGSGRIKIGAIEIGLPLTFMNEKIHSSIKDSIVIALCSFLVFVVVMYIIIRKILLSLRVLTKAVASMGELDYEKDLPSSGKDEIGILVDTFNTMRKGLKETYTRLQTSEQRYSLAVKGSNDGIWDWDLSSGYFFYSPRWLEILGYSEVEVTPDYDFWESRIHPDNIELFKKKFMQCRRGNKDHLEIEYKIKHKNGNYRWVLTRGVATSDGDNTINRIAGSQSDITAKKETEKKLIKTAYYDSLTNLPNRVLLLDRIHQMIKKMKRNNSFQFALMYLDYDGFKHVNDTYGHYTGDLLLSAIAQRMNLALRPNDTVSRVGGDEFVILLDEIESIDSAIYVASRILKESSKEFILDGHSIFISVSVGITINDDQFETAEDLIQNADAAMYQAKLNGKGQYCVFDSKMLSNIQERWKLENELHKALDREELEVYYQPSIDPSTNRIVSFESLIRWKHSSEGLIFPDRFIPAAEESGFITEVTKYVLNKSAIQAVKWNMEDNNQFIIYVNVSAKDFLTPGGLVQTITDVLDKTGCLAQWLGIEVTERVLIQNYETVSGQLEILKKLGVKIELDDFGTGYSSLSYLHRFPLTGLKIDRSFIMTMMENESSRRIVKTIILLAQDLDLEVVAEGVEFDNQLNQLIELKCDFVQGFYFSKALPSPEATEYIKKNAVSSIKSLG